MKQRIIKIFGIKVWDETNETLDQLPEKKRFLKRKPVSMGAAIEPEIEEEKEDGTKGN